MLILCFLIIDDYVFFCCGLWLVLQVVLLYVNIGEVVLLEDVMCFEDGQLFGMVLLDIQLGGFNGIDGMFVLVCKWLQVLVIIFFVDDIDEMVCEVIWCGVVVFVFKVVIVDYILWVLLEVVGGWYVFFVVDVIVDVIGKFQFMLCQYEVLGLFSQGLINKVIGCWFNFFENIICGYVQVILLVLDVDNCVEVVFVVCWCGLVSQCMKSDGVLVSVFVYVVGDDMLYCVCVEQVWLLCGNLGSLVLLGILVVLLVVYVLCESVGLWLLLGWVVGVIVFKLFDYVDVWCMLCMEIMFVNIDWIKCCLVVLYGIDGVVWGLLVLLVLDIVSLGGSILFIGVLVGVVGNFMLILLLVLLVFVFFCLVELGMLVVSVWYMYEDVFQVLVVVVLFYVVLFMVQVCNSVCVVYVVIMLCFENNVFIECLQCEFEKIQQVLQ